MQNKNKIRFLFFIKKLFFKFESGTQLAITRNRLKGSFWLEEIPVKTLNAAVLKMSSAKMLKFPFLTSVNTADVAD